MVNTMSTDPRANRTRQLIIEAFNQLISTRDFNQISVKDITSLATINRATFYAHFIDKYELLDYVITQNITDALKRQLNYIHELDEKTVFDMLTAIADVHDSMHTRCRRGYNAFTQMIEDKLKEQLNSLILSRMDNKNTLSATMFSWALYGSYAQWDQQRAVSLETFSNEAAPMLLNLVK